MNPMPAEPEEEDLKAKLEKLRRDGEERAAQRRAAQLELSYIDLSKVPVSLDAGGGC